MAGRRGKDHRALSAGGDALRRPRSESRSRLDCDSLADTCRRGRLHRSNRASPSSTRNRADLRIRRRQRRQGLEKRRHRLREGTGERILRAQAGVLLEQLVCPARRSICPGEQECQARWVRSTCNDTRAQFSAKMEFAGGIAGIERKGRDRAGRAWTDEIRSLAGVRHSKAGR